MNDFISYVKLCLQEKYFDRTGRASRPEFWWFSLFYIIVAIIIAFFGVIHPFLPTLLMLPLIPPMLSVGWRRFQDLGKPGHYILLMLISLPFTLLGSLIGLPFLALIGSLVGLAAAIFIIYMLVKPGEAGANQYGEPPVAPATTAPEAQS